MKKAIKLSPLLILILTTIYLLVTVLVTDIMLVKWHIVGLVCLAITITTQLFNEKYGYWMTGVLLILGTFAVASFTPTIFTFSIGPIRIDPLNLLTLFLYVIIHRNEIPDWIHELRTDD